MAYFICFLVSNTSIKMMKYPIEPLPEDLFSVGGIGIAAGIAITVSVIVSLVDSPLESVAVNDSVILPAVAGAIKLATNVSALVKFILVPEVCCHK